jgi:hypothetical protein
MKLTDNERMVMNRFNSDTRYSFFDGGYVSVDSGTYASTFIPEMAAAMGKPESSARTVLTSMIKKGIFTSRDEEAEPGTPIMEGDEVVGEVPGSGRDADRWIELTDAGVEIIADLRLEEDEAMLNMDEELEDDDDEEPEAHTKSMVSLAADARIKAAREEQKAGRSKAAKESIAQGKPSLRTSHADCTHATQGKEGKTARAKCRRDRAAAAKLAEEKALAKAERAAKKAAAHA